MLVDRKQIIEGTLLWRDKRIPKFSAWRNAQILFTVVVQCFLKFQLGIEKIVYLMLVLGKVKTARIFPSSSIHKDRTDNWSQDSSHDCSISCGNLWYAHQNSPELFLRHWIWILPVCPYLLLSPQCLFWFHSVRVFPAHATLSLVEVSLILSEICMSANITKLCKKLVAELVHSRSYRDLISVAPRT